MRNPLIGTKVTISENDKQKPPPVLRKEHKVEYGISRLRRTTEFGRPTHGIFQNQELIALTYSLPIANQIVQSFLDLSALRERVDALEAKVFKGIDKGP